MDRCLSHRGAARGLILVLGVGAAWLGASSDLTAGPLLRRNTRIVVEVRPMTGAPGTDAAARRLDLGEQHRGTLEFDVNWPDASSTARVHFAVVEAAPSVDRRHVLDLEARLAFPDGRTSVARRRLAFDEESTALFEIHRNRERSLTLAVSVKVEVETVVSVRGSPGPPVRFRVEVHLVREGRTTLLETNVLRTLVGEPVSYAFRIGGAVEDQAVTIRLEPLRLHGEVAEVAADVTGHLPEGDRLVVTSRRERWVTSRGAVSTLAFETGDPPNGYRFLVTTAF